MHPAPYRCLVRVHRGLPATIKLDHADADRLGVDGWKVRGDGYVCRLSPRGRWIKGVTTREWMHRSVLGLAPSDPHLVDHINGDTMDNRRANLRRATDLLNMQNQGPRARSLPGTPYRGVVWDRTRSKWRAQVTLDGRTRNLGRYETEEEAHAVVSAWRAQHMPFSEDARVAA